MPTIGNVITNFGINTAEFEKGLKRADQQLGSTQTKMNRQIARMQSSFGGLTRSVGRSVTAIGKVGGVSTAAAGGLVFLADRALDSSQRLSNLSKQTGFSVERIQELRFAAQKTGIDVATMDDALGELSQRMGEAAQDGGEMAEGFKAAGISMDEIRRMRPNQVFNRLTTAISNASSESEAAAIAVKTLGEEAGRQLLPVLLEGRQNLKEMADEARELGLVLSKETVQGATQAARQFDTLKAVLSKQFMAAVARLGPDITRFTSALADDPQAIRGFVSDMGDLAENVIEAGQAFGFLVEEVRQGAVFVGLAEEAEFQKLQRRLESLRETRDALLETMRQTQDPETVARLRANLERLSEKINELAQERQELIRQNDPFSDALDDEASGHDKAAKAAKNQAIQLDTLKTKAEEVRGVMGAGVEGGLAPIEGFGQGGFFQTRSRGASDPFGIGSDEEKAERLLPPEDELRRKADERGRAIEAAMEGAARNVQDVWADTFDQIFQGNLDKASDFGDQLVSVMRRTMSEVMAIQTQQALGIPQLLQGAMGGGGGGGGQGAGQMGAAVPGGLGPISGFQGGNSLSALPITAAFAAANVGANRTVGSPGGRNDAQSILGQIPPFGVPMSVEERIRGATGGGPGGTIARGAARGLTAFSTFGFSEVARLSGAFGDDDVGDTEFFGVRTGGRRSGALAAARGPLGRISIPSGAEDISGERDEREFAQRMVQAIQGLDETIAQGLTPQMRRMAEAELGRRPVESPIFGEEPGRGAEGALAEIFRRRSERALQAAGVRVPEELSGAGGTTDLAPDEIQRITDETLSLTVGITRELERLQDPLGGFRQEVEALKAQTQDRIETAKELGLGEERLASIRELETAKVRELAESSNLSNNQLDELARTFPKFSGVLRDLQEQIEQGLSRQAVESFRGQFAQIFGQQSVGGQIRAAGLGGTDVAGVLRDLPDDLKVGSEEAQRFGNAILGFADNSQQANTGLSILATQLTQVAEESERAEQNLITLEQAERNVISARQRLISTHQEELSAIQSELQARRQETEERIRNLQGRRGSLIDSLRGMASEAQNSVSRIRDLQESLAEFARTIPTSDQLSPLSPRRQLQAARGNFQRTLGRARGGDEEAMGRLQGRAQTLLEEGQQFFGATAEFASLFRRVRSAVEGVADNEELAATPRRRAETARRTLEELTQNKQAQQLTVQGIEREIERVDRQLEHERQQLSKIDQQVALFEDQRNLQGKTVDQLGSQAEALQSQISHQQTMIVRLEDQISATQAVRDAVQALEGLGGGGSSSGGGVSEAFREQASDPSRRQDRLERARAGLEAGAERINLQVGDSRQSFDLQEVIDRGGRIPGFAEGGVVNRPTLAAIGEGGKSEAVVPLNQGNIPVKIQGGGSDEALRQEVAKLNEIQVIQSQELARVREQLEEANEILASMEEQGEQTGANLERAVSGQGLAGSRGAA